MSHPKLVTPAHDVRFVTSFIPALDEIVKRSMILADFWLVHVFSYYR
jgi:hypothetical protein